MPFLECKQKDQPQKEQQNGKPVHDVLKINQRNWNKKMSIE